MPLINRILEYYFALITNNIVSPNSDITRVIRCFRIRGVHVHTTYINANFKDAIHIEFFDDRIIAFVV